MHYVLQPYLFWKGHFRQYFLNLLSGRYHYIYCDKKDNNLRNSVFVRSYEIDYEKSFVRFVIARIIHSIKANMALIKHLKNGDSIHFIEFEPLSFLIFDLLTLFKDKKALITVHSIKRVRYGNKLKDLVSFIQRLIYRAALIHARNRGFAFVVHYEMHKTELAEIVGPKGSIAVIPYPCPLPKVRGHKTLSGKRLLIFGQIREDKGIYEFLSDENVKKFNITVAGSIQDRRIHKINHDKYLFIDRFLSDHEVDELFDKHDFLVLPYRSGYTGGAGPLKDSFAYGIPVICSDIGVFKEILGTWNTGFIYRDTSDIGDFLAKINMDKYVEMSRNCLRYAENNNWNTMRDRYFSIYEGIK